MPEIEISEIQILASEGKIVWTQHVALRLRERGIKRIDLIECIKTGEIIEQYPEDEPYPSCLILGFCKADKPLHIVVALDPAVSCCIVTAYRPDLNKWEVNFKTRKVGK